MTQIEKIQSEHNERTNKFCSHVFKKHKKERLLYMLFNPEINVGFYVVDVGEYLDDDHEIFALAYFALCLVDTAGADNVISCFHDGKTADAWMDMMLETNEGFIEIDPYDL